MVDVWPDTFEIDMLTLTVNPIGHEVNPVLSRQLQEGVLYNPLPSIPSVPAEVIERAREAANRVFLDRITRNPGDLIGAQSQFQDEFKRIIDRYLSSKKQEANDKAAVEAAVAAEASHKAMIAERVVRLDSGDVRREEEAMNERLRSTLNKEIEKIIFLELELLTRNNELLDATLRNSNSVQRLTQIIHDMNRERRNTLEAAHGMVDEETSRRRIEFDFHQYIVEKIEEGKRKEEYIELNKINKQLEKELAKKQRTNAQTRGREEEQRRSDEAALHVSRRRAYETRITAKINGIHTLQGLEHNVKFIQLAYGWFSKDLGDMDMIGIHRRIQDSLQTKGNGFSETLRDLGHTIKQFNSGFEQYKNFHLNGIGSDIDPMVFVRLHDGIPGEPGIKDFIERLYRLTGELIFNEHSIQMLGPYPKGKSPPSQLDADLQGIIPMPLSKTILDYLSVIKYFYANLPKLKDFNYKAPDTNSVLQEYLWKYHVHLGEVAYIYSFNNYVRSLGYRDRLKVIQVPIIENKTGYLLEHAKILKTYLQELYVQIFTLNQEGFTRELDETNRQHIQLLEVYNEKHDILDAKQAEFNNHFFSRPSPELRRQITALESELHERETMLNQLLDNQKKLTDILTFFKYLVKKYSKDSIISEYQDDFEYTVAKIREYLAYLAQR